MRHDENNLSTKLKLASYLLTTRSLLILGLLGAFSIMMTFERVQRFNGIPVDVVAFLMLLWSVNIAVLKFRNLSFDFIRLVSICICSGQGVAGMEMCWCLRATL